MTVCLWVVLYAWFDSFSQGTAPRKDILLTENWQTIALDEDDTRLTFPPPVTDKGWNNVDIPHNWDSYEGYRRLLHGNRHGSAWYRRTFTIDGSIKGKRVFLFFEGVGSYASVFVNQKQAGQHKGGRTSFTFDITDLLRRDGGENILLVKVDHPAGIKDLPWVCGGCSEERGFSEGSQPMGIFRPVHLVITNPLRIEPFGVHAWAELNSGRARLFINTTVKHYGNNNSLVTLTHQVIDRKGTIVQSVSVRQAIGGGDSIRIDATGAEMERPNLWSVEDPYLYRIVSTLKEGNKIVDRTETDFGFRTIKWTTATNQFLLNNKPVFINGVAEYEHLVGGSHAFSAKQVMARMNWVKAAGFNAFRDAHQPHNLLYGKLCNSKGILWWTQFSAHVWYDSPEFRERFKELLKEWVIERRNDPSVVLWGLQNESKLPEDFAKECTDLIRSLDPTTSSQRLVTTCNGGLGTDWDVPQNWTGTYGGDPKTYGEDLKKQVLVGEYGAWRTLELHSEGGFKQDGPLSEERMTSLMEQKIRLAESVKDSVAGHFFWLLSSHDNPGRVQGGEGYREIDRVGPVNYKGLLTPWEEPADVFYMFRSNYAPKQTEPMVYIASHSWPGRWTEPGIKSGIVVYSNCDEVELFNDVNGISLGRRERKGIGTHFEWNDVNIRYNLLIAVGYVNQRRVAADTIVLNHLPASPKFNHLTRDRALLKPRAGYHYIYRVNCGGPQYKDRYGNTWNADLPLPGSSAGSFSGSRSWASAFPGINPFFASQRRSFSPIGGTADWRLFQDFRYGLSKLQFEFPVPDGEYLVELFFIEPWLGVGGGMNAEAMRLFDVSINGKTVLKDLDIWKLAGTNNALKKSVYAKITGGKMIISFPKTEVGQAIISAIAIASRSKAIRAASPFSPVSGLSSPGCRLESWAERGDLVYRDEWIRFHQLPPALSAAYWVQLEKRTSGTPVSFRPMIDMDVFVAMKSSGPGPGWLKEFSATGWKLSSDEKKNNLYAVYRKRYPVNDTVSLLLDSSMILMMQPADGMQPAYDQRPVVPFRIESAEPGDGTEKREWGGRQTVWVNTNGKANMQWQIRTGVADVYSLTVKYFFPNEKPAGGQVQLIDSKNSVLLDEQVSFTFTREGKWNQFTIHTPTMINAGNYTVKVIVSDGEGLALSGIDVQ